MNKCRHDKPDAGRNTVADPIIFLAQSGIAVTLRLDPEGEYAVHLGLDGGGELVLTWFEAMIVGQTIATAGDMAGRVNNAGRVQDHVGSCVNWPGNDLGVTTEIEATSRVADKES